MPIEPAGLPGPRARPAPRAAPLGGHAMSCNGPRGGEGSRRAWRPAIKAPRIPVKQRFTAVSRQRCESPESRRRPPAQTLRPAEQLRWSWNPGQQ